MKDFDNWNKEKKQVNKKNCRGGYFFYYLILVKVIVTLVPISIVGVPSLTDWPTCRFNSPPLLSSFKFTVPLLLLMTRPL